MTLKVIEAQLAPTKARYYALLAQLPITVTKHAAFDASGQRGTRTDYRLKGVKRVSRFSAEAAAPLSLVPQRGPSTVTLSEDAEPTDGGFDTSEPSVERSWVAPFVTKCESFDENNVSYMGECATEAEIDAAITEYIAISSDVQLMETETSQAGGEFESWCETNEAECWISLDRGPSANRDRVYGRAEGNYATSVAAWLSASSWTYLFVVSAAAPGIGTVAVGIGLMAVAAGYVWVKAGELNACWDIRAR